MGNMADSAQEFSGRSVDEAIAEGLAKLGIRSDQADIEVLSRGSRGIFGIGSEPARVRVSRRLATSASQPAKTQTAAPAPSPVADSTPNQPQTPAQPPAAAPAQPATGADAAVTTPPLPAQPAPPVEEKRSSRSNLLDDDDEEYEQNGDGEAATAVSEEELTTMAVELLGELVQKMGFEAQVVPSWHDADDNGERFLLLNIHGNDVSPLIGRRGETLASIQYLVRLMINQRIKRWKNIIVDVEQYKERRVNQLTQLAKRMAEQVAQSGRAVSLEPMPANERRIVHLALRDHPSVYTQSSGEGDRRKVHIVART